MRALIALRGETIELTERQSFIVDKLTKGFYLAYCKVEKGESWYCLINTYDEFIDVRPDVARNLIAKHLVVLKDSEPNQTNYILNPKVRTSQHGNRLFHLQGEANH
jgi:hypothetical protein